MVSVCVHGFAFLSIGKIWCVPKAIKACFLPFLCCMYSRLFPVGALDPNAFMGVCFGSPRRHCAISRLGHFRAFSTSKNKFAKNTSKQVCPNIIFPMRHRLHAETFAAGGFSNTVPKLSYLWFQAHRNWIPAFGIIGCCISFHHFFQHQQQLLCPQQNQEKWCDHFCGRNYFKRSFPLTPGYWRFKLHCHSVY